MAKGKKKKRKLKVENGLNELNAMNRLNGLKEEVARELGLDDDIARRGWANLTSRETGKIGGHMAQRIIKRKKIKK